LFRFQIRLGGNGRAAGIKTQCNLDALWGDARDCGGRHFHSLEVLSVVDTAVLDTKETQAIELFSVICSHCGEECLYPAHAEGINMILCIDCIAMLRNGATMPEPMYG
jgi:hypothetical protein